MTEVKPVPVQIEPKRDIWEKIGAVSPLLCGLLISAVGTYCTYTYNKQQIKIQQVQTIGNFIPHLMGNEQSKKAAILALNTMTDSETASKFAQIFASTGTVSALQSMTKNGSDQDKAFANQALAGALQNLAQQDSLTKAESDYEKKLIGLKNSGSGNSYTAYNMNKLAQIYIMRGQYDLAEQLLNQSLALRNKLNGPDNLETCDTLRGLAEVYFNTGRKSKAEATIAQVNTIEQKPVSPANPAQVTADSTNKDVSKTPVGLSPSEESDQLSKPTTNKPNDVPSGKETKDINDPTPAKTQLSGQNPSG